MSKKIKNGDWLKHTVGTRPMYFLYLGRILSSSGIVHEIRMENGKKIEVGEEFISKLSPINDGDKPKLKIDYDPSQVPGNKPLSGGGGGARAKAAANGGWESVSMVNPDALWPRLMKRENNA
jgi:hypothetical protein